ncbi:MAG: NUDIX hydrolase [Actinomycetota bacterium]
MTYTPILGTLAYVLDSTRHNVLLVHRNRRSDDQHLGKWNGLGGKLENDENLAQGLRREIEEEAGLRVTAMHLRGTVSWPGFGPNGEDWFSPIFLVTSFETNSSSTSIISNHEGDLHWIPIARLLDACSDNDRTRVEADLPLWEGDRYFIPLVFDDDPRIFHGVMPYEKGRPVSWTVERW